MPYIDYDYYSNDYQGVEIDSLSFEVLVKRASDVIDVITSDHITNIGFDTMHERIKEKIKKATAAQVEFMHLNGGAQAVHGNSGISSASIGGFSYSASSEGDSNNKISPSVIDYLRLTGLLYKGVNVR